MKILLIIAVLALPASSQTAKVIPLTADEAIKAKQLHDAARTAQKASDEFDQAISSKYAWASGSVIQGAHIAKEGWDYGIEFSEDYRFIVPKRLPQPSPYVNGCMQFTPASGSLRPYTFDNPGSLLWYEATH